MNVDNFKKLNDYVQNLTPESLAKDMKWRFDGPSPINYVEEKHRELKKNFLTFFMNLDTMSQALFLAKAMKFKGRGTASDIELDIEHEFEGQLLEINAGFSYDYDSDYGADADGNRGEGRHSIGLEAMTIYCNDARIDTIMSKDDYEQLEKEIDSQYSEKALERHLDA